MFVRSGDIPSPGQTSIDQTNDCAMKSERGALVRGYDPPSGHSVHKTTGDRWRAPDRRLKPLTRVTKNYLLALGTTHISSFFTKHSETNTFGRCCVEYRRQKFSIPLRWQKIGLSSGLGEERRTPRATSRPLDHGST